MSRGRFDRDELLARTDLPALLDELSGPATTPGRSARWRCPVPDHDDVHPSVTVITDRRGTQRWRCWSGGHGGTAIDAIRAAFRMDYREAIAELARRGGLQPGIPEFQRIRPPLPPRRAVPLHANAIRYVEACERLLFDPIGRPVLDYLTVERGLDPEVLRVNRVGADPGTGKLRRAGGLPKAGPGAVFPALSGGGVITYLQTRYLDPDEHRAKYGNPASRLGDNPRHGWTRPVGAPMSPMIVCEGFPDAYTANSAGYEAIAVLGATSATPALAQRLAGRIGDRPVIVALDGDNPGRTATGHLVAALAGRGIMVVELALPSGTDFNSWVHSARQVPELGPPLRPVEPLSIAAPVPASPGP